MRERTFFTRPWHQLASAVLLGSVLGVIGPFGSFPYLDAGIRVALWVALVCLSWLLALVTGEALIRVPVFRAWPPLVLAIPVALVAALPGTVVGSHLMAPGDAGAAMTPLVFYGDVMVLSLAISFAASALFSRSGVRTDRTDRTDALPQPVLQAAPSGPVSGLDPSPFLARLPARLGCEVLAVETQDHYLRIHTSLGSDLLLMRMRDAVAELAGIDGKRVHRQWWVARAAIERLERRGNQLSLVLKSGLVVPVARSSRSEVRRWLGFAGEA